MFGPEKEKVAAGWEKNCIIKSFIICTPFPNISGQINHMTMEQN
jgi:hypothetical protein